MKRAFDVVFAFIALTLALPVLLAVAAAIFLYDRSGPLYVAPRVGKGGKPFPMVKLRSMIVNADRTGQTSTSATDRRVTPIGHLVRRWKLDEVTQLWNVLKGDMSLVGPRPNVPSGVAVYTAVERHLLDVRPGITDFASIVFADEAEILRGHPDPDLAYDHLIRPWKSRLGLFYIERASFGLDLKLIGLTILAIVDRRRALNATHRLMLHCGAAPDLARLALRQDVLVPAPPPGAPALGFTAEPTAP